VYEMLVSIYLNKILKKLHRELSYILRKSRMSKIQ
jgi:hypothetical protein